MTDTADPKSLADQAEAAYQEGDFENAARLYGEAASAFQALGKGPEAAEQKNNQSVAALQAGNAQAALEAAAGTAQVFAAAGDVHRQGMAIANEGTALEALKRPEQAVEKYLQAADIFKQSGDDQMRASVMQAVAGIRLRSGKLFEALSALRAGLADVKNPTFTQKIMKGLLRLQIW